MIEEQKELAYNLLHIASDRLKNASDDVSAFNILSALQIEHFETSTHSQIIFYLLSHSGGRNTPHNFLLLFLQVLGIPQKLLSETWNVYRERVFDSGMNRIDLVIESKSHFIIIEMKIGASDGDRQLIRYETVAQKRGKKYAIYYLTLDGHMPEEQSAGGIDADKVRCISFQKEIVVWLQECMKYVDIQGYKYSFLKQYLGAVRHIADTNDEVIGVKDFLNNSAMAKAAKLVTDSFYEKMNDIEVQLFQKLDTMIRRKTKLQTLLYDYALDVYLKEFTCGKHLYRVTLYIQHIDTYLVLCFGFCEVADDDAVNLLRLDEAEKTFPSVYKEWMGKLDSLEEIPRFKRWRDSRYLELEDSRGAKLNFSDYSAQIELIDEMDQQCKYISDYIAKRIIAPLLNA